MVDAKEEMKQPNLESLASRYRSPGVIAIALMGSFARGDAGVFSDVDIVRFHKCDPRQNEAKTCLVDDCFVVVSDVGPSKVEGWFTEPEEATACIAGVCTARPLWDPDGYFEEIQNRAREFVWDTAMQDKANAYAGSRMVGWIEEVLKGLEGLRTEDEGRMLNARYGLSWGLTEVMRVQKGVLISGDNASYPEVVANIGGDSKWAELSRGAFGITDSFSLTRQVKAGLGLYIVTAEILADVLKPGDKKLIDEAVRLIKEQLEKVSNKKKTL